MITDDFKNKTIRQIRLWAWLAAVLPLTGLAGIAFVWKFGTDNSLSIAILVGEIVMFSVAVIWWWWVIFVLRDLAKHWDKTKDGLNEVTDGIRDIKTIVRELFDLQRSKDK